MAAALAVNAALIALIALIGEAPITAGTIAGTVVGIGMGVTCTKYKCTRDVAVSDGSTSVTFMNGMQSWPDGSGLRVVMTYPNGTSDRVIKPDSVTDRDVTLRLSKDEALPERIYVTNHGAQALCLAGVNLALADGKHLTVAGDLGRVCGADYYEASDAVLPQDTATQAPSCVWISATGFGGVALPGLEFQLTAAMDGGEQPTYQISSVEDLCAPPYMNLRPTENRLVQRAAVEDVTEGFDDMLVKSHRPMSSAVRLCESKNARGPHFLSSAEKLFCDMDKREIYPVCEDDDGDKGTEAGICFSAKDDELVEVQERNDGLGDPDERRDWIVVSGWSLQRRVFRKVVKTFRKVDVWD